MRGEELVLEGNEVNVKSMTIGYYRGVPYYRIEGVTGKKGYSYNLNKGMYPTLSKMMDALLEERDAANNES